MRGVAAAAEGAQQGKRHMGRWMKKGFHGNGNRLADLSISLLDEYFVLVLIVLLRAEGEKASGCARSLLCMHRARGRNKRCYVAWDISISEGAGLSKGDRPLQWASGAWYEVFDDDAISLLGNANTSVVSRPATLRYSHHKHC
jgi:hypothetical protein